VVDLEVHAAHAAHAATGHATGTALVVGGHVGDRSFGGDQQRCNRSGVLQRGADDLGRIDDAGATRFS
jgi:hypothetical protein